MTPKVTNDPTADYRKYPKGPNFLLIVILASVVMLIILALAVFILGGHGRRMLPHGASPTPNSLVVPIVPTLKAPIRG